MINEINGDLLSVTEGVIVHGCNACGVMGSGVALAIKNKYPAAYREYTTHINESLAMDRPAQPGTMSIYVHNAKLIIINLITQATYGRDPRVRYVSYDAIDDGFRSIDNYMFSKQGLPQVLNFPLIGSGLGNGNWAVIKEIIEYRIGDSITKNLYIKE